MMINIKEINEKLARLPEPPEVTAIRENILNTFSKLEFVEVGHQYFLPRENGEKEELISVSKLCQQFEQEDDWDVIATRYALKHNMEKETVQRMWHENNIRATNNGTSTHLYGEMWMHFAMGKTDFDPVIKPQYEDGYLIPYGPKERAVEAFWQDLFSVDEIYPVLAETRVYTGINNNALGLKQNYAGTFDMLFAIKHQGKWKLLIYDYKTNGSLTSPFKQENDIMMKAPFNYMVDESKSHYTLQLSAYQLALEQLGYEVIDRKLIWVKDDETYEKISLPDVTKELRKVLS